MLVKGCPLPVLPVVPAAIVSDPIRWQTHLVREGRCIVRFVHILFVKGDDRPLGSSLNLRSHYMVQQTSVYEAEGGSHLECGFQLHLFLPVAVETAQDLVPRALELCLASLAEQNQYVHRLHRSFQEVKTMPSFG